MQLMRPIEKWSPLTSSIQTIFLLSHITADSNLTVKSSCQECILSFIRFCIVCFFGEIWRVKAFVCIFTSADFRKFDCHCLRDLLCDCWKVRFWYDCGQWLEIFLRCLKLQLICTSKVSWNPKFYDGLTNIICSHSLQSNLGGFGKSVLKQIDQVALKNSIKSGMQPTIYDNFLLIDQNKFPK